MLKRMMQIVLVLSGCWLLVPQAHSQIAAPAAGALVPDLKLQDIHRRKRSLSGFQGARAFVIVFLGNACPLANLYVPTLIRLNEKYQSKGAQFLAVNANDQDSFLETSSHAQERNIPFPVLKDFDHAAADALGATRTPEAFVLDDRRVIRYHGRIDDQYGIGYRREKPQREDLRIALDELLAGRPVTVSQTPVSGCVIGRAATSPATGNVTYSREVSRILQERCVTCHRAGQAAPFALTGYSDTRLWSATIREVIEQQRMPPWHADPRYGRFANALGLTPKERWTLLAWINNECPEGDPKDLPAAKEFPDDWTIGKPDAVFSIPQDFQVPASGVVPYQRFTIDPGFKEDRWIQAAEARPTDRTVVHHIAVYIHPPGKKVYQPDGTVYSLVNWTPGETALVYPEGIAKRIPADSRISFEIHYTPKGKVVTDRSCVAIRFAQKPPRWAVQTHWLANIGVRIPAGVSRHSEGAQATLPRDTRILSFMPHMHWRGIRAEFYARYPDGRKEILLSVPDYDFSWQRVYRFAQPLFVPKGTVISWTATWDNSPDNPRNPDPTKEVRWGDQTTDEMMSGWMEYVWDRGN